MSKVASPVKVRILDKEYRIACDEGEEEDLLAAARLLDTRMQEIRDVGKVIGTERIAVVAALNMANDLLSNPGSDEEMAGSANNRIKGMRERIETALNESNQLEL